MGRLRRVLIGRTQPLDEVGERGIFDHVGDADLLPGQVEPVRAYPVSIHGGATESSLDRRDVVDSDDPGHPSAAVLGTSLDRLAEQRLVRGGVIEGGDDLDVGAFLEREDEVAGAKPRVTTAVDERAPQLLAEPLHRVNKLVAVHGVGDVVQAHGHIVEHPVWPSVTGVRKRDWPR